MDIKAIVDGLVRKYETRDPFAISAELGLIVLFKPLVDMRGFQCTLKRRKFIFINGNRGWCVDTSWPTISCIEV